MVIAVAGTAAARADGAGTECRADNSVVPFRAKVPQRRRAKTRAYLMQTRVACSRPTAVHKRLEALVHDLQQLRDETDRIAFAEPSPDALREYRRANRELAEAQRAFSLASA